MATLQDAQKRQIAIGPHTSYRGYQQLGTNVTRYGESFQRDWHEAIDLYREMPADANEVRCFSCCNLLPSKEKKCCLLEQIHHQ